MRLCLSILALSIAFLGCGDRKRAEITGVGPYVLGTMTLKEASGACNPDKEMTWCTTLRAVAVGEQSAGVDLYFDGHGDNASLVEILLVIRGCRFDSAKSALTHEMGKPTEELEGRMVWTGKRAVVIARLPGEQPTVCEVSFVHPSRVRTIEYLKTGKWPPKESPAP